ncbi:MAG TPA: uroporphyrinogen-III synthase [Terriglobales bacterium]|jgi:uroporphyrinogen-III synthase|nr:uroporphyrinogen-III synthase [Terriglobales bacterium]
MNQLKPLAGTRILVGRAPHQASAFSAGLKDLGAEVIEIPFLEIRPPRSYQGLDSALKRIAEFDWLILTSVNGVDAVASRLERLKIRMEALCSLQIAAIGPSTKAALEKLGLKVEVVPRRYIAESVVESLREKVRGKRVLLARARVARDVIPRELHNLGAKVEIVEAYETRVPATSEKSIRMLMSDPGRRPNLIALTSSSSAKNFMHLLGGDRASRRELAGIQFASIGPVTSATLRELGLPVHIEAREFTIPGLIQAILAS